MFPQGRDTQSATRMNERECNVLVAVQVALLGAVSARLRQVSVQFGESDIHFDCYFDGAVEEDDADAMAIVETELAAAFPPDHSITHSTYRLDFPRPLPKPGRSVFLRKEVYV